MPRRRTGRREPESNRMVLCAWPACRRLFAVCGGCDHGRRYCRPECALEGRRAQQRDASRAYQGTERGRRAHAARQARYRSRPRSVTQQSRPDADGPSPGGAETYSVTRHEGAAGLLSTAPLGGHHDVPEALDASGLETRASTSPALTTACRPPRCVMCGLDQRFMRFRFHADRGSRPRQPPGHGRSARRERHPRRESG